MKTIVTFAAQLVLRVIVAVTVRLFVRVILAAALLLPPLPLDGDALASAIRKVVRDLLECLRDGDNGDAC